MNKPAYATAYNIRFRYLSKETKQAIVQRRNQYGWTREELNILCEFVPNTIYKVETGHMTPTIYQLNRLNSVLHLDLQYCS
jgi:ribosome-binding protein aMBF1 (putative translation factor)